jgi:hypothetical protein
MDVTCKRSYPYDDASNLTIHQEFLVNKNYNVSHKFEIKGEIWYRIEGESRSISMFNNDEFNDYFIDIKKERKQKLLSLKSKFQT